MKKKLAFTEGIFAVIFVFLGSLILTHAALAVDALPEVGSPPAGDPRLEPIPGVPIHLKNFNVKGTDVNGTSVNLTMRFPPRVNGQNQSDGDKHADMFVFYFSDDLTRVPGQLPVVEAVPLPLTANNLKARLFSPIWELSAVLVDRALYGALPGPITSALEAETSPAVVKILQTNIFLNCPIVPDGTTVDAVPGGPVANEPTVQQAFFEGQIVNFVPYDIEDGGFNPQILFIFKDEAGNLLTNDTLNPGPNNPHMVASKAPGEPFYSTIWEIWTVTVPVGTDVTTITSAAQITLAGVPNPLFTIESTGIRLNCPVVAIDGTPFPFEDGFALLSNVIRSPGRKPIHFPEARFTPSRTFLVTEVTLPITVAEAEVSTNLTDFPPISPDGPPGSDKGNVIPIILVNPYQTNSSGPNTTGERIRFEQADLDAAALNGLLPADIETNVATLIADGLLSPEWAPGVRPYFDRLAQLVGRALFEMVWDTNSGGDQKDVTSCLACHSMPHSGGAARGLYTLRRNSDRGGNVNPGSMWGSGPAELLRAQLIAAGAISCNPAGSVGLAGSNCTTFAHGSTGGIAKMRDVVAGAFNAHMGMQTTEFVLGRPDRNAQCGFAVNNTADASLCDYDRDGVSNELSAGEVTAATVFLANLPVPRQANDDIIMDLLGTTPESVQRGKFLFRRAIDRSGVACATCHKPFTPLSGTELVVANPETAGLYPIEVTHHAAEQADVDEGLAQFVGQAGLRNWGDFELHKMGNIMKNGNPARDVMKSAELWDVGAVYPWGRDGRWGGTQLKDVILAHEGTSLQSFDFSKVTVTKAAQKNVIVGGVKMSTQKITIKNTTHSDILGSLTNPIRVILTNTMTPGILASNPDGTAPDGGLRQGAFWKITQNIVKKPAPGVQITLTFINPTWAKLKYGLSIQDDEGYSEAAASAKGFRGLNSADQEHLMNFLRAQLVGGKVGEGSGLVPEPMLEPVN